MEEQAQKTIHPINVSLKDRYVTTNTGKLRRCGGHKTYPALSPEFGDFDDLDRVLAGEILDVALGGF